MMLSIWAGLKGLSFIAKVSPWLGFLGPVGAIISAAINFVVGLVTKALRGFGSILTNPAEICALALAGMLAFALGIHWGHKWTDFQVDRERAKLERILDDLQGIDDEDTSKTAAALQARQQAEDSERRRIDGERDADRVRSDTDANARRL